MGFFETWALATFSPRRLAMEFPARHSSGRAIAYSLICLLVAAICLLCLVFVGVSAASADSTSLTICLAACLGLLTALNLDMSITPSFLASRCPPAYAVSPYHFWRGLILYTSGFIPLVAAAAGVMAIAVWGASAQQSQSPERFILAAGGGLLVVVLAWWEAVMVMIKARTPRTAERIAGYLLSALGFILALAAGALAGVIAFFPLYAAIEMVRHLAGDSP